MTRPWFILLPVAVSGACAFIWAFVMLWTIAMFSLAFGTPFGILGAAALGFGALAAVALWLAARSAVHSWRGGGGGLMGTFGTHLLAGIPLLYMTFAAPLGFAGVVVGLLGLLMIVLSVGCLLIAHERRWFTPMASPAL